MKIQKIFKKLKATTIPKSWYQAHEEHHGIAWHFTDINNMASILSKGYLASKYYSETKGILKNNNASTQVNDSNTAPWVHDFVRFYLRPKTPTQYRNEGIFPEIKDIGKCCSRLIYQGELWTEKPAHLPIPVFIGFDLEDLLNKGAIVTKGSLAGRKNRLYEDSIDTDLQSLSENIEKIFNDETYGFAGYKNLKHTEVIFPEKFLFEARDIIKIVVRTEAEKVGLLTMLSNESSNLSLTKEERDKLDIQKYKDRIIVDRTFFHMDAGYFYTEDNKIEFHNMEPEELIIEEQPYHYSRAEGKKNLMALKLVNQYFSIKDV